MKGSLILKDDLISKSELIKDLMSKSFYPAIVKRAIERAPIIDAMPVRHGYWNITNTDVPGIVRIECSECFHDLRTVEESVSEEHYCRYCGALMDREV